MLKPKHLNIFNFMIIHTQVIMHTISLINKFFDR